jgi:hypothetical protein
MLFQSSPGNLGLIEAFARVGDPVGGSELAALFELLPNDTDFTVFRDAGFAGLNLIFADGHVQYHSPTDTPVNLDRSSLQHHGDNLLRLAQVFGEQQLPLPRGDEVTFFSLFGRLVWYPEGLTVPLALLALGIFAGSLWYARRRGARLWGVAIAAATIALLLAAAGGLGVAVWWALGRLRPGYQSLDWGSTYRPEWYEAGLAVLAVTAAAAWYLLVRRWLLERVDVLICHRWFSSHSFGRQELDQQRRELSRGHDWRRMSLTRQVSMLRIGKDIHQRLASLTLREGALSAVDHQGGRLDPGPAIGRQRVA